MSAKVKLSHVVQTVQPALMSVEVQPCDIKAVAFREDTGYRKYLEVILVTDGPTVRFGIPKDEWKNVIDRLIEFHEYTEIMPEGFGYIGDNKDK
ncbi:MAG: hypothetical protein ACXAEN_21525 [Candidatus Thorarchaeota archaeon]|jgi:hypothetical protein